MKISELKNKINKAIERLNINSDDQSFEYYGLRFEDKARNAEEICECSKHNPDRDDDRDFPEYDNQDYNDLDDLDGTSAWKIDNSLEWVKSFQDARWQKDDSELLIIADHCYIIASNDEFTHADCDPNEIVLDEAIVVSVIF